MKAKMKIGIGLKTKKKKPTNKRVLSVTKRGILPILSVGSLRLVDQRRGKGVAKAINNKIAQHQLEKLKRHNRVS